MPIRRHVLDADTGLAFALGTGAPVPQGMVFPAGSLYATQDAVTGGAVYMSTDSTIASYVRLTESRGAVSILDHGAHPGAVATQNTSAINAALLRVGQAGGGVVTVPNAVFDTAPGIQMQSGVLLQGVGEGSTLRLPPQVGVTDNLLKFESVQNAGVEGVRLVGQRAFQTRTGYGLYMGKAVDCYARNVSITGFLGVGAQCWDCDRLLWQAIRSADNFFHGMEVEQTRDSVFSALVLTDNARNGLYVSKGEYNSTGALRNVFSDLQCHRNGESGVTVQGPYTRGTMLAAVQCTANGAHGMQLFQQADQTIVQGFHCERNKKCGVYVYQSRHGLLTGGSCVENSQEADGSYSEIMFEGAADGLASAWNQLRDTRILITGASRAAYAVKEATTSDGPNFVTGVVVPYVGRAGSLALLHPESTVSQCPGYRTRGAGTLTANGTGAQTAFPIPHGLDLEPLTATVTAGSPDAQGPYSIAIDATNITVTFATAPVTGTGNVILRWATHEPAGPTATVAAANTTITTVQLSRTALTFATTGESYTITATAHNAMGELIAGAVFTATPSDTNIVTATVGTGGNITLTAGSTVGTATVTVAASGVTAVCTVTNERVAASVAVSPDGVTLTQGTAQQMTATVRDAGGAVLAGQPVTWSVSGPATISTSGLLTADASLTGDATVTATVTGTAVSDTAVVTVTLAPYDRGFAFRKTAGYVTDAAGVDYVTAADHYPVVRGSRGEAFGWTVLNVSPETVGGDDSQTVPPELAGECQRTNAWAADYFRVDLPAPGDYVLHLAAGDAVYRVGPHILDIYDDQTLLTQLNSIDRTDGGYWMDATQTVIRYGTQWKANEQGIPLSFASTVCRVQLGGRGSAATGSTNLAFLRLVGQGTALAPDTTPASVTIDQGATTLVQGASTTYTATVRNAAGAVLSGVTVAWSTSDATIAAVNANGVVTAQNGATGTVTITATVNALTDTVAVTVEAPVGPSTTLFPGRAASHPFWASMQFVVTDFRYNEDAGEHDWVATHYDRVMSGPSYAGYTPPVPKAPYTLIATSMIPTSIMPDSGASAPDLQVNYYDDWAAWIAAQSPAPTAADVEACWLHDDSPYSDPAYVDANGYTSRIADPTGNRRIVSVQGSKRFMPNMGSALMRAYQVDRYARIAAARIALGEAYWGAFVDEADTGTIQGPPRGLRSTHQAISSGTFLDYAHCREYPISVEPPTNDPVQQDAYYADYTATLAAVRDNYRTLGYGFYINTANYGSTNNVNAYYAAGGVHKERVNSINSQAYRWWGGMRQAITDGVLVDLITATPVTDVSRLVNKDAGAQSTLLERVKMWELCSAFMCLVTANPTANALFFLDTYNGNWSKNMNSTWIQANEANIGTPTADPVQLADTSYIGNVQYKADGVTVWPSYGKTFTYRTYQRAFTNAVVFCSTRTSVNYGSGDPNESDGTAYTAHDIVLPAGEDWRLLLANGTLGPLVTGGSPVSIRNSEGLIYVRNSIL